MDVPVLKRPSSVAIKASLETQWPLPTSLKNQSRIAGRVLRLTDGIMLTVASGTSAALLNSLTGATTNWMSLVIQTAAALLLLFPLASLDLYPGFGVMRAERLRRRFLLSLIAFPLMALCAPAIGLSHASPLITGLLFMALSPLTEDWARSWLIRTQRWGKAALVSGSEPTAASIAHTLKQNLHLGLLPVRSPKDLPAGEKLDTAILAPGTALSPTYDVLPHLYVLEDGGILHPLQQPTPWLARLAGNIVPANPRQSPWRLMKRMIDLAVGSIALLLALPLIVLAAAFIYARDPGPVFYSQMRRGLAGKPIRIWKLRSMYKDSQQRLEKLLAEDPDAAAEWHSRYKLRRDPRILPGIGAFIRTFSIDELPQLFAVLRGELSLVGPRVFVDYDLDIYNGDALRLRQSVMPGLTGLWQVAVRSTGDNSDKPLYDIAYVRNWSIWSDIDILYRTIDVVITGRGAT